jgi:hypothetical protein
MFIAILEKHTASIFSAEEQTKLVTNQKIIFLVVSKCDGKMFQNNMVGRTFGPKTDILFPIEQCRTLQPITSNFVGTFISAGSPNNFKLYLQRPVICLNSNSLTCFTLVSCLSSIKEEKTRRLPRDACVLFELKTMA